MSAIRTLWSRLLGLVGWRHRDPDLAEDIRTHLALLTDDYLRQGLSPPAARAAARRAFGGIDQIAEAYRDRRSIRWLDDLGRDLRFSLRSIGRDRRFTAAVVGTLALGLGATTAMFSVINAVAWRPLAVPHAERLVRFVVTTGTNTSSLAHGQAYAIWRDQVPAVEQVAGHRLEYVNLTGVPDPEHVPLARVTAAFLPLFQAPAQRGRLFSAADDVPSGPAVAMISHALWTRRYQRDPAIVGRPIVLGHTPHTIIGVLGTGVDTEQFDVAPDVWVPLQLDVTRIDGGNLITVTGRLTEGTTLAAANAQLAVANERARPTARGDASPPSRWRVMPLHEAMIGDLRPSLRVLAGAVWLLLLIACANVSTLLLARTGVRAREMAIRTAVGAGRGRLMRQLLTETLLLTVIAGALGLGLGAIGVRALLAWYPGNNPFVLGGNAAALPRIGAAGATVGLDGRVLAFTLATTLVSCLLVGVWPAWYATRVDLVGPIRQAASWFRTGRPSRTRATLVTIEVALALVLLTGSALLVRTSWALQAVERGFDTGGVLTARSAIGSTRFETREGIEALTREGTGALRALPGVAAVAATCCMPLETVWQLPFVIQGRPPETLIRSGHLTFTGFAGWTFITPGYFDVLRIPLRRGRDFAAEDRAGAPGVAIINEEMARRFWPDTDPLGAYVVIGKGMRPEYDEEPIRQIVGIVGNVRDTGLTRPVRPAMYVPMGQEPDGVTKLNVRLLPLVWMVRTTVPPARLSRPVADTLERMSGLPVTRIRLMHDVVSESTALTRFNTILLTVFGGCALLLATIGIYAVTTYVVQQRTTELGIRAALGASVGRLHRMVVRDGVSWVAAGIVLGLGASLILTRLLAALLFGVGPHDPVALTVVPVLLALVAAIAVWIPARRVLRLDPGVALRSE